jgi:hypothetical protein
VLCGLIMLQDLNSPKTKAIFAAARELDALHRLWRTEDFVVSEMDQYIGRLQLISVEHFHDSGFIRSWLVELRQSMLAKQEGIKNAKERYENTVAKLDSEEGFQTVFI